MKKKQPKIETHGKDESLNNITMLEQVWGYNEFSRYGTLNVEEYTNTVKEMNRSDLESHARKIGIVIVESSERLQKKLITEFEKYVSSLNKPKPVVNKIETTNIAKILAEGR